LQFQSSDFYWVPRINCHGPWHVTKIKSSAALGQVTTTTTTATTTNNINNNIQELQLVEEKIPLTKMEVLYYDIIKKYQ